MSISPAMQAAAKDALTVQDASNLCGVVQAFARHMLTLNHEGNYNSIREHPVTILFMDKLNDMTGRDSNAYFEATTACEAMRDGKEPAS